MSFLGEIKRRKVFKVAAVYAVVAWLTIQIVDVVGEPLNLPDWFDTFVIVLFAVGLPIAVVLAWAFDVTPEGIKSDSDSRANQTIQVPGQGLNLLIQGLVLLAVVFLVADQYLFEPGTRGTGGVNTSALVRPSSGVRRFAIPLGETRPLPDNELSAEIAISRSGTQLAYVIDSGNGFSLFLRSLNRLDAVQISSGRRPFFSEDGERLGVFGGGGRGSGAGRRERGNLGSFLRSFSLNGGPPQAHLDPRTTRKYGGSWHDDTVVFSESSTDELLGGSLYQLSTTENSTELLLAPEPGEAYVHPEFLPDGNAVLFTIREVDGSARDGAVAVLSLKTGEHRLLIENGFDARYAPTGHLVFARAGALWAVAFDPETLEVSGIQTPVVDGVQMDGNLGDASYGFSDNGMLVYVEGGDVGDTAQTSQAGNLRTLAIVGLDGTMTSLPMRARAIERLAAPLSGERAAVVINEAGNQDIYIYDDFTRIIPRRLTFDSAEDDYPIWTPDGERVVFWSTRDGGGIFAKPVDGTGQAERLTTSSALQRPASFAPDGSEFFFIDGDIQDSTLYRMSMSGETEPEPLLQTGTTELYASLSSDGHWLAYSSGERGQLEVYIEPYPNPSGSKWQVSTGGYAMNPVWIDDDNELMYFDRGTREPMRVAIETEPALVAGAPEQMRTGPIPSGIAVDASTPLGNDGQRFLAAIEVTDQTVSSQTMLLVVDNWFEELETLTAPSN